jgi:acetyl esterase/lipase
VVRNVVHPTLTAFLPKPSPTANPAIIVCPCGGFRFLSWESEGTEVAQWLSAHGIAAFVLKYRLLDTGPTDQDSGKAMAEFLALIGKIGASPEAMRGGLPESMREIAPLAIADARQAVKVVREQASAWNIDRDRIGVLGFSTGATVALGALGQCTAESRPDFVGAIYGAALAGVASVPAEAVPLFILCANDDPIASLGSVAAFSKWQSAGYPAELHIYAKGGHGFALRKQDQPTDHWIERFNEWLEGQGLLKSQR